MLQLRVLGAFVVGENCWQTRKASWEPFLELPPVLPRHICCPEVFLEGLEVDGLEEVVVVLKQEIVTGEGDKEGQQRVGKQGEAGGLKMTMFF